MEAVVVALIGLAAGIGTVAVGSYANRRLGLGQPIEEKINARLKVLNDHLEEEVKMREDNEAECAMKLDAALKELEVQRDLRVRERDEMMARLDDLEATKARLLARLGMSMVDQAADAASEKAGQ